MADWTQLAQKCGATVYRNRTSPHTPAIAFGDEAWAKFCVALDGETLLRSDEPQEGQAAQQKGVDHA